MEGCYSTKLKFSLHELFIACVELIEFLSSKISLSIIHTSYNFKHSNLQGRRTGSKIGGAEIFAEHYSMPWALAHGHVHVGGSGGMLPQKILEI